MDKEVVENIERELNKTESDQKIKDHVIYSLKIGQVTVNVILLENYINAQILEWVTQRPRNLDTLDEFQKCRKREIEAFLKCKDYIEEFKLKNKRYF